MTNYWHTPFFSCEFKTGSHVRRNDATTQRRNDSRKRKHKRKKTYVWTGTTQAQAQAQEEGKISFFLCRSHVRFLAFALMIASLRRTCEPAVRRDAHNEIINKY